MESLEPRDLDYCPFYCEENVWRLLGRPEFAALPAWAVAVFADGAPVPVLRQRLGRSGDGLIHWDYHVFALVQVEGHFLALDFDSDQAFPSPAPAYLEAAFPPGQDPPAIFRLMEGGAFLAGFSSDRSHMRFPDGSWRATPPAWPCPAARAGADPWTLASILDPLSPGPGRLLGLGGFQDFLARGV